MKNLPDVERPLGEVWAEVVKKSAHLNDLDSNIWRCIDTLERKLRAIPVERILSVRLPDGADLGWSYHRRTKRWRFVIRNEDDAWDLKNCTRSERAEVFTCGAMSKLVALAQQAR